jgi:ADP-ribosylglycohydrolase
MRASPLGIFGAGHPLDQVATWGEQDAELTHVNQVCRQCNVLYVMAIADAIRNGTSAENLYGKIATWAAERKVDAAVAKAVAGAQEAPPEEYTKQSGWILIAFRNALWQLLHASDPGTAVIDTVGRGGDTDTNGAICGALLGAVHGLDAIPAQWREKVLQCRPKEGTPGVRHPRPECYWPVDALELADRLLGA